MREMLYAIDLGLIALFTSIAMMSFLRPGTAADGGGETPQIAAASAALRCLTGAAPASEGEVVVAFRVDAPPFSSKGDDGFEGFIADLCEQAVPRAGYRIGERVEVTAESRLTADVDLVCDPMTVTSERAGRIDFSPILFIANSTFLEAARPHVLTEDKIARSEECARAHAADPSRDLVGVGMVMGTTAEASFDLARETGSVANTLDHALCRFGFESHAEGVAEICDGYLSYYFGDLDILRAEMERQGDCAAQQERRVPLGPRGGALRSLRRRYRVRDLPGDVRHGRADGTATVPLRSRQHSARAGAGR